MTGILELNEVGQAFVEAKAVYEQARERREAAAAYSQELLTREREVHAECARLGDEARRARIAALDSSVNRQADAAALATQRRAIEQQYQDMVEVVAYFAHVVQPKTSVAVAEAELAMVEAEADAYDALADAREQVKIRALAQVVELEGEVTVSGGETEQIRQYVARLRERVILLRRYVDEARAEAERQRAIWEGR